VDPAEMEEEKPGGGGGGGRRRGRRRQRTFLLDPANLHVCKVGQNRKKV
jgi:hypothetical protein